ncbi:MAG: internalin [Bacteroidales bacterium]|nr:internalin [Bacteroidales bacterium]
MSTEEINNLIEEHLPVEIDGYTRRIGVFNGLSTIMYSKDGSFLGKYLSGNSKNATLGYYNKTVLFEVIGRDLKEAYLKIKEKIELNKKVKKDFPKNMIFDFKSSFKLTDGKNELFIKLFEVYLVLDTNSDSQFFCVVSINPLSDAKQILPVINDLKNKIKEKNFIKLSGDDENFDYSNFDLPRIVHLYSYDFKQSKEEIRKFFTKHGWKVKLKDKYIFEKEELANQEKIILCEGRNYKILNYVEIPKILFSEEHNSVSIFQNVKTRKRYCLRDKDYLIDEEIKRLRHVFPKYYILDYYCIENYLYHPDNIEELKLKGFNKHEYIENIITNKNKCLFEIISNFKSIRKGYKELTENHIKEVKNANTILIKELQSNDFDVFYKHFDMKSYNKEFLERFNLTEMKLVKTDWFKNRIIKIINKGC